MPPSRLAFCLALTLSSTVHAAPLAQGVAAGDLRHTAAMLWAMPEADGIFRFEVATDADFSNIVGQTSLAATGGRAVKWDVGLLEPGIVYYYRGTDATGKSSGGTFRTPKLSGRNGLRFGVTGDWQGELAPYPAVKNAAGKNLDFFVMLGDTIYAEDYHAPGTPTAATLEQYRAKYGQALAPAGGLNAWKDVRQSTAIFATIDDHEVVNDFAGGAPSATDARFPAGQPYINETSRYQAGLQAFHEAMPIRELSYGATGDPRTAGKPSLYRSQSFGQDAALFLLDARSFRDAGLPGVANTLDPVQVGTFLATSATAPRTLLGAQQLADLKSDLKAAQQNEVTWKFIMLPEPIQNLGVVGAADRFEGYARERNELLQYIAAEGIENVVFVTADIHGTLVNNLSYRTDPLDPASAVPLRAWEISTGAVAFDAPFGPTVLELGRPLAGGLGIGLPTAEQFAALPTALQDQLIRQLVDTVLSVQGYDSLGLDGSGIPFRELAGDHSIAADTWGWTEFEIDPDTQALTVTTWGLRPYVFGDDTAAVAGLEPMLVSRFQVAAVPEPETWALLLAGLGLVGAVARQRRGG